MDGKESAQGVALIIQYATAWISNFPVQGWKTVLGVSKMISPASQSKEETK